MRKKHKRRNTALPGKQKNYTSAYQILLLTIIILIGVLAGALLVKNNGKDDTFNVFLQSAFADGNGTKGFVNIFSSAFFSSAVLLCATFFMGLCAAGLPVLIAIPAFLGAGIGYTMAYLYSAYGTKGIAFSAVCILPQAVLSSIAIIVSCREGIRYSFKICRAMSPNPGELNLWEPFMDYCYKFVVCFVIVVIAAILESVATLMLSGLIQ